MYVFIPEHFSVRNVSADSVRVYAQTYLSRGVRFFSTQGRWVLSQTYSHHLNADSIHWLYLLYTYNRTNDAKDDLANALVFRENAKIVVEITDQMKHDTIIRARFHNISFEEIASLTENSINYRTNTSEPLDLSIGSLLKVNTLGKKIASRKKQMLPCDLCGKEFDRPSLLKRHIRTHTGERPHVCDVCGKGFSTSSSLNTHKRIHSGERPHQCGICGKRFTASSNLYYHRLTHSTEKPHKCDICGKSFPTPGNLRSHKYSHGGLSPYKCTICLRVFTKQTNLKNHISLHKH